MTENWPSSIWYLWAPDCWHLPRMVWGKNRSTYRFTIAVLPLDTDQICWPERLELPFEGKASISGEPPRFVLGSGHAPVAQWIEHLASNQGVGGSSPSGCATSLGVFTFNTFRRHPLCALELRRDVELSQWSPDNPENNGWGGDHCVAPKRRTLLPQPSNPIDFKDRFVADDRYIFRLGLSNQHTIEGVFVRSWQKASSNAVRDGNSHQLEPFTLDLGREVRRQIGCCGEFA
jgi:hypothetical protein